MGIKHIYPVFRAKVDASGRVLIEDREAFDNYARQYCEKENMSIILKPYRKQRSRQEEKYYHAVTKMMIAEALGMYPEEAHTFLCNLLLTIEESKVINGKTVRFKRTRSTTELDNVEYQDFWKRANQWASLPTQDGGLDIDSGLGLYIPDPNEADWEGQY